MNIKRPILIAAAGLLLTSCGNTDNPTNETTSMTPEEIIATDSLANELEQSAEDIEKTAKELDAAVDDLLEGLE